MDSVTEYLSCGYEYASKEQIPGGLLVHLRCPGGLRVVAIAGRGRFLSHGSRKRLLSHAPVGETLCDLFVSYQCFRCLSCRRVFTPERPRLAARARISEELRRAALKLLCVSASLCLPVNLPPPPWAEAMLGPYWGAAT